MPTYNVLIVDDDPSIRKLLHDLLANRREMNVLLAAEGKQAVKFFATQRIDIVLTDIHMPGFSGLEMLSDMMKIQRKPEIIVMTANGTPENVEKSRQVGARSMLLKPFDNLDTVEAEIQKALDAVTGTAGNTASKPARKAPPAPRPARPAIKPFAAARPAAPAASPSPPRPAERATRHPRQPVGAVWPAPAAPPAGQDAVNMDAPPPMPGDKITTRRMTIPEINAWQRDLIGNETPPPAPSPKEEGRIEVAQVESGVPESALLVPTAVAEAPPRPQEPATAPAEPPAAVTVQPELEIAIGPSTPEDPQNPAGTSPSPIAEAPTAATAPSDDKPSPSSTAPAAEGKPAIPPDLESIFRAGASLDVGKMKMQVPVVCLQTMEEGSAIAALGRLAASLHRDFYVWSAARGFIMEKSQATPEIYRDPARALEFARRQKGSGLYLMADFRTCLEDRTVVRTIREMVMEGETARCMLVLTAPRMTLPPELQPVSVQFNWPEPDVADLETMFEEVKTEVAISCGRGIEIGPAERDAMLQEVKDLPSGRARFEIARILMFRARRPA